MSTVIFAELWPIGGTPAPDFITSACGHRYDTRYENCYGFHDALDIQASFVPVFNTQIDDGYGSYPVDFNHDPEYVLGKNVTLALGPDYIGEIRYCHLDRFEIDLPEYGPYEEVSPGQHIAYSGTTPHVGAHLHYNYKNGGWLWINPLHNLTCPNP